MHYCIPGISRGYIARIDIVMPFNVKKSVQPDDSSGTLFLFVLQDGDVRGRVGRRDFCRSRSPAKQNDITAVGQVGERRSYCIYVKCSLF